MLDEEFGHFPWSHLILEMFAVGLAGTARVQHCQPLYQVDITSDLFSFGQKDVVFYVENTRGSICPFKEFAQLNKIPALIVGHGCVGDPLKQMAALHDPLKKLIAARTKKPLRFTGAEVQKHSIELLKHLRRDLFPHGSSTFARRTEARVNRVRVHLLK